MREGGTAPKKKKGKKILKKLFLKSKDEERKKLVCAKLRGGKSQIINFIYFTFRRKHTKGRSKMIHHNHVLCIVVTLIVPKMDANIAIKRCKCKRPLWTTGTRKDKDEWAYSLYTSVQKQLSFLFTAPRQRMKRKKNIYNYWVIITP